MLSVPLICMGKREYFRTQQMQMHIIEDGISLFFWGRICEKKKCLTKKYRNKALPVLITSIRNVLGIVCDSILVCEYILLISVLATFKLFLCYSCKSAKMLTNFSLCH